jgi:hypothetical protein
MRTHSFSLRTTRLLTATSTSTRGSSFESSSHRIVGLCPLSAALGPASRLWRRYANAPAGALLTGRRTPCWALPNAGRRHWIALERDEIRLGPFSPAPDAAQQECCEPGSTLLCMGLFSRFFVQALPCTAEGTLCRVRDTRSLVPRAYGTNRSNSNTSCLSLRMSN